MTSAFSGLEYVVGSRKSPKYLRGIIEPLSRLPSLVRIDSSGLAQILLTTMDQQARGERRHWESVWISLLPNLTPLARSERFELPTPDSKFVVGLSQIAQPVQTHEHDCG